MQSKTRLRIELIFLALILVGIGGFVYLQKKQISVSEVWNTIVKQVRPVNTQVIDVQKEKNIAEENYQNFQRANILDDLLNSDQYKQLQGTDVNINTADGVGNPEPFNKPKVQIKP
jgi:hypothetical protein